MLQALGRHEEALGAYLESAAASERLVAIDSRNLVRRRELAITRNQIGFLLNGLKRWDEAIAAFRQSLAAHPAQADPVPLEQARRSLNIAASHHGIAEAHAGAARIDDALAAYREAVAVINEQFAAPAPAGNHP